MEQHLIKPKVRDLFVLLKRESLINLQQKQELNLLNYGKGQRNKLRRKKYADSKTQHRVTETQKDLIVILEEHNDLKQTEKHLCHEEITPIDKNVPPEPVTVKEIQPPSKSAEVKERNDIKQTEKHLCHKEIAPIDKKVPPEPVTVKEIQPLSKSAEVEEHGVEIHPTKNLCADKVPVYRHVNEDVLEKSDLYEFDEIDSNDSDKEGKTNIKKKKRKINVKKRKPVGRVTKKTNTCKSYEAAMQEVLQKLMKKINDRGKPETKEKENVLDHTITKPQESAAHTIVADVVCNNQDGEVGKTIVEENRTGEITTENNSGKGDCVNKTIIEVNKTYEIITEINDSDNDDFVNDTIIEEDNTCEIITENNNSDRVDCVYSPTKSREKIHIISDVTLNESSDYLYFDESLKPNANSTVLPDKRSKPWRFDIDFKRNPYYLDIKKTALPSLQQDIIIDYVLVKKIEELFAKVTKKSKKPVKKSPPAKKLKSKDVVDKENISSVNLFDSEDLLFDQPKPLQENLSPSKNKRNVLGPKIQNEINIMKPVNVPKEKVRDIQTYFLRKSPNKSPNKELLKENLRSPPKYLPVESIEDNSGPKLFEEEEPVICNETPKRYAPRRRKIRSDSVESNHEKHKRQMTKAEEAELEQWAASFNSMCDDIDKYELEIE